MITSYIPWEPDPSSVTHPATEGVQGNAWNAAATGAAGLSAPVHIGPYKNISVFGNTSGASTITVQLSQDGSTFYDSGSTISANGNFGANYTVGAQHVRLKSSADVTATATIAGKA